MSDTFKAVLITRDDEKKQSVDVVSMNEADLMEGNVTVQVEATGVNYKDGLAVTGKSPVVRRWPMIPGIDFAGTVLSSSHSDWVKGDKVILNGWGVGEVHYGGFAARARVNGDWLVRQPNDLTARDAMAIGTAGYTAMLSVLALEERGLTPAHGPVLVTGAAGGVGSIAIALLSARGFDVLASTGRPQEADFLKGLGASDIIDRAELSEPGRPLGKERFAGAIDSVGSTTLANVLAQIKYGGTVAACGLAQGFDLPTTVMPFILRGVTLAGIDSVMAPKAKREAAWAALNAELDREKLNALATDIGFDDLLGAAKAILDGTIKGRVVASF